MITARDGLRAVLLLFLGLVLGVGVSVGETESKALGIEGYTPTRLEWLAVVLNAENPHDDLDKARMPARNTLLLSGALCMLVATPPR